MHERLFGLMKVLCETLCKRFHTRELAYLRCIKAGAVARQTAPACFVWGTKRNFTTLQERLTNGKSGKNGKVVEIVKLSYGFIEQTPYGGHKLLL